MVAVDDSKKGVDLSICTVTYDNRKTDLEKCLTSIYENVQDISFEIIVVDNASTDETIKMIEEYFPDVHIIKNAQNIGYAPAMNQAWLKSSGKYIMTLSSDAELLPGAVDRMIKFLEEHKDVGVVGPKTYDANGKIVSTCHSHRFMLSTIGNLFLITDVIKQHPWMSKILRCLGGKSFGFSKDYDISEEVRVLDGGCLLFRRELINNIGLLDDKIFIGPDDYDWCYRVRKAGYKLWYLAESEIIHLTSSKSALGLPPEYIRRVYLAMCYTYSKQSDLFHLFLYKNILIIGLLFRIGICLLKGEDKKVIRAYLGTLTDILRY